MQDLAQDYSGVCNVVRMNNAEMEICCAGGGNWAEHRWVKQQLHVAKIQREEGPGPIVLNCELYLEFKSEREE